MNVAFTERLNLRELWKGKNLKSPPINSLRSAAHYYIRAPLWANVFENYDPGVTSIPTEFRHPYFDLRLVEYLLGLPSIPWCVDKELLRVAMCSFLPEQVLHRPKAPLVGFPVYERLKQNSLKILDIIPTIPKLDQFIDMDRFLKTARSPEKLRPSEYELITRPLALALWLYQLRKNNYKLDKEELPWN